MIPPQQLQNIIITRTGVSFFASSSLSSFAGVGWLVGPLLCPRHYDTVYPKANVVGFRPRRHFFFACAVRKDDDGRSLRFARHHSFFDSLLKTTLSNRILCLSSKRSLFDQVNQPVKSSHNQSISLCLLACDTHKTNQSL